jgi:hypothetical protein
MPILVMALLALTVFGLIGILLIVAVILEHSTQSRTAESNTLHAVTSGATLFPNPNFHRPRGADSPTESLSEKENVHEHACTG